MPQNRLDELIALSQTPYLNSRGPTSKKARGRGKERGKTEGKKGKGKQEGKEERMGEDVKGEKRRGEEKKKDGIRVGGRLPPGAEEDGRH